MAEKKCMMVAVESAKIDYTKTMSFDDIAEYLRSWAAQFDNPDKDYGDGEDDYHLMCPVESIVFNMGDGAETIYIHD